MSRGALRAAVAALFFLSGLAALVYEVLWIRGFSFVLGNTSQSMATVLAAFMAGLALGSALGGRYAHKARHPLVTFALLEFAIGAAGLTVFYALQAWNHSAAAWLGADQQHWLSVSARFVFTFVTLMVPTTLMGAGFPLLSRLEEGNAGQEGSATGILYGANTLGAAAGSFLAGYYLVRTLGTMDSAAVAAAANVLAAAIALGLAWKMPSGRAATPQPKTHEGPQALQTRWMLAAFFLTGATSFSYELVFSRLLSYVVGNRIFAVSTVLTTFLLAIALGSLAASRWLDKNGREIRFFAWAQIAVGVFCALSAVFFADFVSWARSLEESLNIKSYFQISLLKFMFAAAILALPAFLFGASFPAGLRYLSQGRALSSVVGKAAAVNTAGCIVGSLATGFWLIPWLGAWNSLLVASFFSMVAGHRFLAPHWPMDKPWLRRASNAAAAVLAISLILFASGSKRYPFPRDGLTLKYAYEDSTALLTIWDGPYGIYMYGDDTPLSFPMGKPTAAERVQRLQAQLPLLLHPDPKEVLVVGLGFGTTSGVMAVQPGVEQVDTVEIQPGLIKAADLYPQYNHNINQQPKSVMHVGDGRYFLGATQRKFDIISTNLTDPDLPGSAACYTLEYLQMAARALKDGGIFSIHVYGPARDVIFKTTAEVFPYAQAFRGYRSTYFLLASNSPIEISAKRIDQLLKSNHDKKMAARKAGIWQGKDILELRRFSQAGVRKIAGDESVPINTDDFPVIEYQLGKEPTDMFKADL